MNLYSGDAIIFLESAMKEILGGKKIRRICFEDLKGVGMKNWLKNVINRYHFLLSVVFDFITVIGAYLVSRINIEEQVPLLKVASITWIVAVIVVSIKLHYRAYLISAKEKEDKKKQTSDRNAKIILSNVIGLVQEKAESRRSISYKMELKESENPYFYNVHEHTRRICEGLRDTVAQIIGEDKRFVDVSLIYQYIDDKVEDTNKSWKWIAGKSDLSDCPDLGAFIETEGTLYNYVTKHLEEMPLMKNEKSQMIDNSDGPVYKPGRRDKLFKNKGSVYVMPINFSNNEKKLVQGILMISTYGINFVKDNSTEAVAEFEKQMSYEIIPTYVSLIQNEFGAMYLRHMMSNQMADSDKNQVHVSAN